MYVISCSNQLPLVASCRPHSAWCTKHTLSAQSLDVLQRIEWVQRHIYCKEANGNVKMILAMASSSSRFATTASHNNDYRHLATQIVCRRDRKCIWMHITDRHTCTRLLSKECIIRGALRSSRLSFCIRNGWPGPQHRSGDATTRASLASH